MVTTPESGLPKTVPCRTCNGIIARSLTKKRHQCPHCGEQAPAGPPPLTMRQHLNEEWDFLKALVMVGGTVIFFMVIFAHIEACWNGEDVTSVYKTLLAPFQ